MFSRRQSTPIFVIWLLVLAVSPALAEWKAGLVGLATQGRLAVDSAGITHIVCITAYKTFDLIYRTYNRKGVRGPVIKKNVGLSFPLDLAITTDSKNHPHVAIIDNPDRKLIYQLRYLVFKRNRWESQLIDSGLNYLSRQVEIIVDSKDQPHILYLGANGLLTHAFYDGSAWQFENAGVDLVPYAVRIALDGTIHVAGLSPRGGVCEERGINGSWTGECFDPAGGPPVLTLTADGTPEVAYSAFEGSFYNAVKMARFDGANWSTATIFNGNDFGITQFEYSTFAIDSAGLVQMLIVDPKNILEYVTQQGDTWNLTKVVEGIGFGSESPLTLRLDRSGLPRLTFGTNIGEFIVQLYLGLNAPVLTNQWQSVVSKTPSGKDVITGKLNVNNIGTAPGSGFVVNYYVSSDSQLDSSDTLLGRAKLALAEGQRKVLTLNYSPPGSVSGKYLIAVITSQSQPDVNASNNVSIARIP